jgi:hypothetical protein
VSPAEVDWPLVVSRDGEQRGFVHVVEGTRLEVEFFDARGQTRVEELIRVAQFDEVEPARGKEFRDWAVRFITLLQSEGYVVAGTVAHDPQMSFGPDDFDSG